MMRASVAISITGAVLFSACAGSAPMDTLRPRSALDLGCSSSQMTYTQLSGACDSVRESDPCKMGVTGCGKHATYVYAAGAWVMNGAGQN